MRIDTSAEKYLVQVSDGKKCRVRKQGLALHARRCASNTTLIRDFVIEVVFVNSNEFLGKQCDSPLFVHVKHLCFLLLQIDYNRNVKRKINKNGVHCTFDNVHAFVRSSKDKHVSQEVHLR